MTLSDLPQHKKRTVADLIRYIGNTTEDNETSKIFTPNYSILLGSGASVTSGIRTGQDLIKEWKNEVLLETGKNSEKSIDEFFSSKNAPDWYDENNAYSVLFENRYDLQRHRRIFVEHEVFGKTPSIGYAYLVKLIENGFFNTVFTTNFDDLLNEAFYRFSKNRPIVCAHDSSISSISVTSSRPKIIKLHGDYLFDNIKTTIKETESLETNMKLKFQEFAKDFGLIVVGYAGNDRSIMDILTYLLQHEDYFKNGIYWCIRKGERNFSPELKKLLWRDRVFYVEIDGFDELFAEFNHILNGGVLPIDDTFLSRAHQEAIIKELTENKWLNVENKFLAEDFQKLKDHFEENFANEFIEYIRNQNADQTKNNENRRARRRLPHTTLSSDEKRELNDLVLEAFGLRHPTSVLQKLQKYNVFELEDGRFKIELLGLEATLKKEMNDDEVKKYFDELIRLDPMNESYYELAANRSSNPLQSLQYLKLACDKFKNDFYIINLYIKSLLNYWEDRVKQENFDSDAQIIDDKIKHSLKLFPYIDNEAYSFRVRFHQLVHADDKESLTKKLDEICEEINTKYEHHPQTLKILRITQSKKLTEERIKDSLAFYSTADNEPMTEKIYIELLHWYNSHNDFNMVLKTFGDFESEYIGSDSYKLLKGDLLMDHEYFDDAIDIFRTLTNIQKANYQIMTILAYKNDFDELSKFYNNLNNKDEYTKHYYNLTNNYKKLVKIYQEKSQKTVLTKLEATNYAFSLLKIGDYNSVTNIQKPYYDNPKLTDGEIIVNYLYASLKNKMNKPDKIKKRVREKIFDNKFIDYSNMEKLGAACVLEDKSNIILYLDKAIKGMPINKYIVKDWPILKPYINDNRIRDLLSSHVNKLDNARDKTNKPL